MAVTIRKRKSKTKGIVLYADIVYNGRRKKVVLETKDLREAQQIAATIERNLIADGWGEPASSKISFDSFVSNYLEYSKASKAHKTYIADRDSLNAFQREEKITNLADINEVHFEHFRLISLARIKPTSVNVALRHLKAAFSWATEHGFLETNPAAKVRLNRIAQNLHPRFLKMEEVERLRQAAMEDTRLLHIINFALWTGMRRKEIITIRWGDVDLERRTIVVQNHGEFRTKSGRSRVIPINASLLALLQEMKRDCRGSELVFKMDYWVLGKQFSLAAKKAGLGDDVHIHTLRHTFASHLVMQGVDLPSVQQILGHHDISVTMLYSHLSPEHLAHTVEKLPY